MIDLWIQKGPKVGGGGVYNFGSGMYGAVEGGSGG